MHNATTPNERIARISLKFQIAGGHQLQIAVRLRDGFQANDCNTGVILSRYRQLKGCSHAKSHLEQPRYRRGARIRD